MQSRGHFLTGGYRERHFDLFKTWANRHMSALHDALGGRYVMYGEWVYAKHTVYYDALPHFFLEFDVLDTETSDFLSTDRRLQLLGGLPVRSVPVLHSGGVSNLGTLASMIGRSAFKTDAWYENLIRDVERGGLSIEYVRLQTDPSEFMEGIYIKDEEEGRVAGRYKYVRPDFLTTVIESESHWQTRPILPNRLAPGVDMFEDK